MNRPTEAWTHNRSNMRIMRASERRFGGCSVRRARLLAARRFGPRSIPRSAILRGDWDQGALVREGGK